MKKIAIRQRLNYINNIIICLQKYVTSFVESTFLLRAINNTTAAEEYHNGSTYY